jgi:putative phage-type endonuclease
VTIANGTCITHADRVAWLAEKMDGIGSSESSAALGISPYRDSTPLALYLRKIGAAPPVAENAAMRWGTRLEPIIAEAYSEESGHTFIAAQKFLRSADHPFMLATLDRVRDDGRIVELKCVGARSAHLWGEAGSDEVPDFYLCQVLHQMIVAGTDVVDVAALIGGNDLRIYEVRRDDDVAARIVSVEEEFWDRVLRRDPPPIDPSRDGAALARLWPRAEGEVELGPDSTILVNRWEATRESIRFFERERDEVKCELLDHMKEAASARLTDGRILSRKVITVAAKPVPRTGYTFTDLRVRQGKS